MNVIITEVSLRIIIPQLLASRVCMEITFLTPQETEQRYFEIVLSVPAENKETLMTLLSELCITYLE
jgi:hypothetical protein